MSRAVAAHGPVGRWQRLTENPAMGFVDSLLRGTGQVMFQNNPITGLLFLVGIFYNSRLLGACALIGLVSSTLAARLLGIDRSLIGAGLFGFNGVLVGIGLAFFLEFEPYLVAYIVLGGIVSTVLMAALANLLSPWDMPALTAPFVLTTWMFIFVVYQFDLVRPTELIVPATPDPAAPIQTELRPLPEGAAGGGLTATNLGEAFFRGIGEVMFEDNLVTGAVFLAAIAVNSRIAALMATLGSAVGMGAALLLGADGALVYHGLYGFNSVLCAIALGGLFFVATWKSVLYAALAAIVGALGMAFVSVLLSPVGMPALTAPFVLVTWLFLLAKAGLHVLQPVGLAEVSSPEQTRRSFRDRGGRPTAGPRAA